MRPRHRKSVPTLWLMTDERLSDGALLAAAARLPKGRAGIILRHYRIDPVERRALFEALRRIARRRRLMLLLAGSARDAAAWRADGAHGRDRRRAPRPLIHSAPVHNTQEAQAARRADLCFVSPLFRTRSHPGAPALGRARFAAIACLIDAPVMALGGVRPAHRHMLRGIGASGWGAIDGLTN